MLDLDFFYKLSDPVFALSVSLPVVVISLILTFVLIKKADSAELRKKQFALLAEIMVVFGVVGIFAFSGRVRNDHLSATALKEFQDAKYSYDVNAYQLKNMICSEKSLAPTRSVAASEQACRKFNDAQRIFAEDASLEFLARDYQKILELPDLPSQTMNLLSATSKSAWTLIYAKHVKTLHESKQRQANRNLTWEVVILFAFVIASGVGIKCGKAVADLCHPKQ